MDELRFEWDEAKDWENQRKHGVSFAEARSVFFDPRGVEYYDDERVESEERFLLLGLSAKLRILLVCHCVREGGNVIRLISARKATKSERRDYPWGGR